MTIKFLSVCINNYFNGTICETHRICKHCPQMRGKRQKGASLKQNNVDNTVNGICARQQNNVHHNEFSVQNQEPSHNSTYYPANVPNTPHLAPAAPVVHVDLLPERGVLVLHHFHLSYKHFQSPQWLHYIVLVVALSLVSCISFV